ncbi:RNA polymerase sigma factor [Croceicoccus mobilis]|uniref:RNA polymerase sigma factor n=1 Tax=Croceicoccus mobilis TaxID=1703339 RepID=UPI000836EFC1|nr:sigma-70 family RNA polymerase sigma factor [Croceicoccus mobilis]
MDDRRIRAAWLARNILPHEASVRRWLERRVPPNLDVDDIIHEAYVVLGRLENVDEIRSARSYFYSVANSVMLQQLRRAKAVPIDHLTVIDELEIASTDPLPDKRVQDRQELDLVMDAIEQLSPKCREVFVLRKVHGFSQKEIAARLQIAESTVEKHVIKGIRELMQIFGRGGKSALKTSTGSRTRKAEEQDERYISRN